VEQLGALKDPNLKVMSLGKIRVNITLAGSDNF
jgi:hypothetical protein